MKGFGGLNLVHDTHWHHAKYRTSVGYVVGAALGYKFGLVSVEGEFSYRHNHVDRLVVDALDLHVTGNIQQWCGFGNVFVDFPVTFCFAPYIGAGGGYRHAKPGINFDEASNPTVKGFIDSADQWGVYQVMAGLGFAVSRNASLQLEYRYMDGWSNLRCSNHTVDLSANFRF